MVQAYSQKIFNGQLPVFDGRRNLYSREPLPIGREKVLLHMQINIFTGVCAVLYIAHIFQVQIRKLSSHIDVHTHADRTLLNPVTLTL